MGQTKALPQYAEIEQPFGCDPPHVHCPICGHPTTAPDDNLTTTEERVIPCPHLQFIFLGEGGEFAYQSEACKERFASVEVEDLSVEDLKDILSNVGYGNSLLALEIMYGGMACGPVGYVDVYGFDYATLSKEG